MQIPRHWAKVEEKVTAAEGVEYALRSWGCSALSADDARQDAQRRLEALKARMRDGYHPEGLYAYRQSLIREQVVAETPDDRGGVVAMVTRNRYGSLVLNTARILFLDVDLGREGLLGRVLAVVFRGGRSLEERTLEGIEKSLATRPDEGFRIYRTARGFRVMGVSGSHDPRGEDTQAMMRAAGVDRAFMNLCRVQDCFRARLTPKPWRIGVPHPRLVFPLEGEALRRHEEWCRGYEAASAHWSVCRLVKEIGPPATDPVIRRVIAAHDEACGVGRELPLA